jgi:Low-density lipoprotein receptor repeat class B
VFGHRPRLAHSHQGEHPHPLRRQAWAAIAIATVLAVLALLLLPPHAHGNFVYWSEGSPNSSIGRAKINGSGLNNAFITGLNDPHGIAVDSKYIYWSQGGSSTGSIGRANLDGTGANPNFIPHMTGVGKATIAVTPTSIYWANESGTIGRANLDGSAPLFPLFGITGSPCGLAADSSFLYFADTSNSKIGRATLDGTTVDPNFVSVPTGDIFCGLAVDSSFVYYPSDSGNTVGRGPIGGGTADPNFIAAGTTGGGPTGVAVNSQYVFWGNYTTGAIGRANVNGSGINPALVPSAGVTISPASQFAAAPSNKITVNSITKKKKKGTATINAKVPGPGQVTLNQISTPPDVNATAAAVKQVGLTITGASSFKLPVKPTGKTAKKLKKQVKKRGKGKVKVKVFIHFIPAGVAGVPNTQPLTVTLVKRGKKKK